MQPRTWATLSGIAVAGALIGLLIGQGATLLVSPPRDRRALPAAQLADLILAEIQSSGRCPGVSRVIVVPKSESYRAARSWEWQVKALLSGETIDQSPVCQNAAMRAEARLAHRFVLLP